MAHRQIESPAILPIRRVVVAKPPVGSKAHLMMEKGTFVMEEQPGNILHLTCAHAGSGSVRVIDGKIDGPRVIGRVLFQATPMAMGVWHLNAGFAHGLIIEVSGSMASEAPMFTAVWHTRALSSDGGHLGEKKDALVTEQHGTQILTDKDCVLYSVLITNQGSGRFTIKNGLGDALFTMPSAFTGSFLLEHVFAKGGLRVDVDFSVAPNLALSWMEVEATTNERPDSPAAPRTDAPGTSASTDARADASADPDASAGSERDDRGVAEPARASGVEGRGTGSGDSGPVVAGPSSRAGSKRRK
jgi:hypothetical protein